MWQPLLLAAFLVAGVRAFVPSPIRWGGISAKRYVLAPSALPSRAIVPPKIAVALQPLAIWDQELPSTMAPNGASYFTAQLDKTIALHGTGLCLEASGVTSGDTISLNICSGEPKQLWNILPLGRGQKNQIQLEGTNECIEVHGKEGGLNGAPVELHTCDDVSTAAWEFEAPLSLPTKSSVHLHPRSYSARDVAFLLASMTVLGALSAAAWLWQRRTQPRALDGQGLVADDGGIPLTAPLAAFQRGSFSTPKTGERMGHAVMLMSEEEVPEKPSRLTRARRWLMKHTWDRVSWRLQVLRKSKQAHDTEVQEKTELKALVVELKNSADAAVVESRRLEAQKEALAKQVQEAKALAEAAETREAALVVERENSVDAAVESRVLEALEAQKEALAEQMEEAKALAEAAEAREAALVVELKNSVDAAVVESRKLEALAKEVEEAKALAEAAETREADLLDGMETFDSEKANLEASLKALVAEKKRMETTWAELKEQKKTFAQLESDLEEVQGSLRFLSEAAKRKEAALLKEAQTRQSTIDEQKLEIDRLVSEKSEVEASLKALVAEKSRLEATGAEEKEQKEALAKQMEEAYESFRFLSESAKKREADLIDEARARESILDDQELKHNELVAEKSTMEASLKELAAEKKKEKTEMEASLKALAAEKMEVEAEMETLAAEKKELEARWEARWERIPSWIKAILGENDEAAVMALRPIPVDADHVVDGDHRHVLSRDVPLPHESF